jgi:hypothetical protein
LSAQPYTVLIANPWYIAQRRAARRAIEDVAGMLQIVTLSSRQSPICPATAPADAIGLSETEVLRRSLVDAIARHCAPENANRERMGFSSALANTGERGKSKGQKCDIVEAVRQKLYHERAGG